MGRFLATVGDTQGWHDIPRPTNKQEDDMIKFDVLNRWSGEVQFTAEIDCDESALRSIKLGLAVKWAIKNNNDLRNANLRGANLQSADLRNANLWNADLRNADLWSADLRNANLRNANLRGANLQSADLWNADLRNADLRNADLWSADLRNANLRNANLRNADLRNADLWSADLWNADLRNANLRGANLQSADLWNADLRNAKNVNLCIPISFVGEEMRQGYAKWDNEKQDVFVRLGCFYDTEKKALEAVGNKYGKRSSYYYAVKAACMNARERKIINPMEDKDE